MKAMSHLPAVAADPRTLLPIPELSEPPNWARLPIAECGEPLVAVPTGERIFSQPVYAELKLPGADRTLRARAGVYERLLHAAQSLPDGIALCLFDGFRPLSVQRRLYSDYYETLAGGNPTWTDAMLTEQVQQFVARPNPSADAPPPHRTGGAMDVFLIETATGMPLDMGTNADEISPRSVTDWYETSPDEPFTMHRRLLFHAMTGAGFSNYRGEWWHYDFGNQRWANCTKQPHAIYGVPIEDR